jgi:hypothetical protein
VTSMGVRPSLRFSMGFLSGTENQSTAKQGRTTIIPVTWAGKTWSVPDFQNSYSGSTPAAFKMGPNFCVSERMSSVTSRGVLCAGDMPSEA